MAAHHSRLNRFFTACLAAATLAGSALIAAATLPTFTDVTKAAGIRFRHDSGAFGKKYLPETMGSGVAFFDADGDGWQDILFVNSKIWPGRPASRSLPALYRNNRDGTFTDVTAASGLGVSSSTAWASRPPTTTTTASTDLYITALGKQPPVPQPWRPACSPTSPTPPASAAPGSRPAPRGSTTTATARLDLFVANYVDVVDRDRPVLHARRQDRSRTARRSPTRVRARRSIATPANGRFEDVTKRRASSIPTAKALGVALIDYNGDGWLDLFVANDTQPNRLYRNKRNGTFADVGVDGGRRVQRSGRGAGRHGHRRRRLRRLGPARAWSSATSRTR